MHQTIMIANYGDTPSSFAFHTTGLGPIFSIKPAQGVVPAKGNVLVSAGPALLSTSTATYFSCSLHMQYIPCTSCIASRR